MDKAQGKQKAVRTCVACGAKAGKDGLLRLVRTSGGSVEFDRIGRKPGRGAYVCSVACLEDAYASHKLQRALRMGMEKADAERVAAEMALATSVEGR